jgi:hypothetical protein
MADGPTGCGDLARGGFLCAWNFSVTRSPVLMEAERSTRPNMTMHCISDSLLAYHLKIPLAKNNALVSTGSLSHS